MDKSLKCKMPGCNNNLPVGRTYECPRCTRQILAAARYFSRPLSELLTLGENDVPPDPHQNHDRESDRTRKNSD